MILTAQDVVGLWFLVVLTSCAHKTPHFDEHGARRTIDTAGAGVEVDRPAPEPGRKQGGPDIALPHDGGPASEVSGSGAGLPAEVRTFLTYLADNNRYDGFFSAEKSLPLDAKVVAPHVADRAVTFEYRVGSEHRSVVLSRAKVIRQVQERSGLAFELLANLGHVYDEYIIERSEAPVISQDGKNGAPMVVSIAGLFELTFVERDGRRLLVRCLLEHEGE